MTVQSTNSRTDVVASAGSTVINLTFFFSDDTHLQVYKNSVLQTTGFTIDGAGRETPLGTVTFTTPLDAGDAITVVRVVPVTQLADYELSGRFPSEVTEDALDKLTFIDQQQEEELARCIKFEPASTVSDLIITEPTTSNVGHALILEEPTTGQFRWGYSDDAVNDIVSDAEAARDAAQASATAAAASESNASTSATDSSTSATRSQEWAENPEDDPVLTGPDRFSALHWAAKAQETANSIEIPQATTGSPRQSISVNSGSTAYELRDVGQTAAPQSIVAAQTGAFPQGWMPQDATPIAQTFVTDKIIPHTTYYGKSGIASSSSFLSSFDPWKAFDGSTVDADRWTSNTSNNVAGEIWLQYEHHSQRTIDGFWINSYNNTNRNFDPTDFDIYLDGTLFQNFTATGWTQNERRLFTLTLAQTFRTIRIVINDISGDIATNNVIIQEFEPRYTDVDSGNVRILPNIQTAVAFNGKVEISSVYQGDKALSQVDLSSEEDGTYWIFANQDFDGNLTGFGSTDIVPEVSTDRAGVDAIPAFSAASLSGWGTASATSEGASTQAYKALNDSLSDPSSGMWATNTALPQSWTFTSTRGLLKCSAFTFYSRNSANRKTPSQYTIEFFNGLTSVHTITVKNFIERGILAAYSHDVPTNVSWDSVVFTVTGVLTVGSLSSSVTVQDIVISLCGDFYNTAELKHYDNSDNEIRRVYLGTVTISSGEITDINNYALGTSVNIPVNNGETILSNSQYVQDQPYLGPVDTKANLFLPTLNNWYEVGFADNNSNSGSGASATQEGDGDIVFQTGVTGVAANGSLSGGGQGASGNITSVSKGRVKATRSY